MKRNLIKRFCSRVSLRISKAIYQSNRKRKKVIHKYLSTHDMAKLQIGCGPNRLAEWLNTDISLHECKAGALYLDAGELFPFPDNSIDYIYSEHVFEHLNHDQAVNMLKESFRVLKPSGTIRIATPDFQFLVDLYLHPDNALNKRYIEWSSCGGGGCRPVPSTALHVINKFHTSWGHQIIYDKETLSALLTECGYHNIRPCVIGKSEIESLNNLEAHFKHIPFEFYQLETMLFEADK